MTTSSPTVAVEPTSIERNQRLVVAELDRLHAVLAGRPSAPPLDEPDHRLTRLVQVFGLSPFERDTLLWCAGVELDSRFKGDELGGPTFGRALARLAGPHWDALSPEGPLRYWRLVELGPGRGLADRPLHIDERTLHFMTGLDCLDPHLHGVLDPGLTDLGGLLAGTQLLVARQAAQLLRVLPAPATVQLDGAGVPARRRVAAHTAATLGRVPLRLPAGLLPPAGGDLAALARLVEREVALLGGLLYVECGEGVDIATVQEFLAQLGCAVLVSGAVAWDARPAPVRRTVPQPDPDERRALWAAALGERAAAYGPTAVAEIADHFDFDAPDIEAVCAEAAVDAPDTAALWRACRTRTQAGLEGLAAHVVPHASWSDLVLPDPVLATLRDVARQARHPHQVYCDWGMAEPGGRGLGITALFTGDSGTGKTLAAEVLAAELGLDLYRVDLAAVISKYIGETEKNLKRVFEAAQASGAVMLFDEADALFGRRSEVKDSHDRYANVEVAYLLQRMEAYHGIAILTTNLKTALDRSFLRRIRFVVNFPFPDAASRARIWRLMLPPTLPTNGVDLDRLARLQLAGGNIRTIALGAAFLAADNGGVVTQEHLLAATRREYAKLEKPLTDAELGGRP
jgi:hypothetical protein